MIRELTKKELSAVCGGSLPPPPPPQIPVPGMPEPGPEGPYEIPPVIILQPDN